MGSAQPPVPDIEGILTSLTVDEKISLLAGKNFWETVPIPSKGVPSVKTSDGPNGARGSQIREGTRAACFPASVCLAATWNTSLARMVGNALAREALSKGAHVLLAPTVCIHRHPLGGRNFESFSEDPLLAGKMAAQYIAGLQEMGVAATIKHFAANEQETDRFTVNETISERALREIYLKPFEIAVKEANPWALMTSYNLVNGTHADSNEFLLKRVLRGDWGWRGLVMSDWGGTNSTAESLNAGLDLEMPGPARWRENDKVRKALKSGAISEETLTDRCRNILELLAKVGKFENAEPIPEQALDRPEDRELIREVGGEGIVLLKNSSNILPIRKEEVRGKKIAVLGMAKEALIHGGGSASVNTHYRVSPWEGLRAALGEEVELCYAKGAHTFRCIPPMHDGVIDRDGKPGWTLEAFDVRDLTQAPILTQNHLSATCSTLLNHAWKAVRMTGTYRPSATGSHYMSFLGMGPTQVSINGKVVAQQSEIYPDPMGFLLGGGKERPFRYLFENGQEYQIEIHSLAPPEGTNASGLSVLDDVMGCNLGFMQESQYEEDLLGEAVSVAKSADMVIVFTGHTPDWETEGQDQVSHNLPANGSLDRLVSAAGEVNQNVIVVNSTGVAVAMPWLDKVSAVVQAWFPGQEAGNTIADVLVGKVNPSGKLPVSFPKSIEDTPAYGNFPGRKENGRLEVRYEEGVFVGYRYYDKQDSKKLLFPFGHGLSYTSFDVSNVMVLRSDQECVATFDIVNSGSLAGSQSVQVYAGPVDATQVDMPMKQLVGFTKAHLEPRENAKTYVRFPLRSLAYFDESEGQWVVQPGSYRVFVAVSALDVVDSKVMEVREKQVYPL